MKTINDYAELVKAEHALNKTIAPVEDGANIAGSYTSGKQFIRGGVLYTALTTIAANTAWSSLTLDTDYELADDITSQLASLNQTLTNEIDKAYQTDDAAITEVASDDLLPIYDTSATAKKKIAVNNFIGGLVSNPNLFDNPWFTVNQRGLSTSVGGYIVDRWNARNTTTSSLSNGVLTITNTRDDGATWFGQRFEIEYGRELVGVPLTWSFLTSSGEIKSWSFTLQDDTTAVSSPDFTISGVNVYLRVEWTSTEVAFLFWIRTSNSSVAIKAFKLEVGSVSTLARDTVPNYATELLKCQRYFQRIKFYSTGKLIGFSFANANKTAVWTMLPIATPMRATPTVSTSDLTKIKITSNTLWTGSQVPTSLVLHNLEGVNCHLTWTVTNDFTAGEGVNVQSTDDVHIDFSADL